VFFDNLSLLNVQESFALVGRFWSEPTQIASPLGTFGLNFDIIETNILNLGVVIGVVIYLGGDVLTSLLNDRKQKILGTLKSADERFLEAQQKLEEAKQKVQTAQTKAIEIREQGNKTAIQAAKTLFERTEDEIRRLEEGKQATLRFEEEKAMSQVRQQVVTLSIEKAFSQLRTKMDASIQRRLIDTNINLLGKL
jgi:F-type H+-transporting ATPase subunit b